MRELVRQIVAGYGATKLEGQTEGIVLFSGKEVDTKQPVWVKIVPRLLGKGSMVATRFRALGQVVRQLNHPNIASVQALGEKAGVPYLVTRAVERAQPLAARLDQPWAVDEAADLIMQVGQALEHAYQKGLVHGSLTPQSIVIQENGQVKVTDFGLSQVLDLLEAQIRQAASPFIAPERNAGRTATARGDVYSLGAILYGLLAGRAPQVVKGEVLPPGRYNADVPPALDQVVIKALAPNPTDRYADVKSLLAALGAVALVAGAELAQAPAASTRCPKCGARNQTSRFCRKCGSALALPEPAAPTPSAPPRPMDSLRITEVRVGESQVSPGEKAARIELTPTAAVTGGEVAAQFPQPLEMPRVDMQAIWQALGDEVRAAMPEPLPMPTIDWAELGSPGTEGPTAQKR